jgi:hypothetical protein
MKTINIRTKKVPARGKSRQAPSTNKIPPDLDQFVDWRFRRAIQLVDEASGSPPCHEDVWIEETAWLLYASKTGDNHCQPTPRQGSIREATALRRDDSLEASVLEARLLAQQIPEEIAARCQLPQPVIEAYNALFFDVRGRVHVWFQSAIPLLAARQHRGWHMGSFLKNLAVSGGSVALEEAIDLLCRLSGPTLAEGLPEPGTVDSVHELIMRANLAFELLRNPNHLQQLQDGIDRYNLEFRSTGRVSEEATSTVVEILHKAKLSATLRKEIQRLRQHCRYAEEAAVA